MNLNFRFAIISDLHVALPQTIWEHPERFHLVEVSILALEFVLAKLEQLNLDFLLIPGDLTQHGEPENHRWLADRLSKLPYPAYVIPGNHDLVEQSATDRSIGAAEFAGYYQKFGYAENRLYYSQALLPGVRLIGLNSIFFDDQGKQISMGRIDAEQLDWLRKTLADTVGEMVLVMIHHNVVEHLPGQMLSPMGRRYMLQNASELLEILQQSGVQLLFTGHLHIQDIAQHQGISEVTTGSLVSYPHPYRILELRQNEQGDRQLKVESGRVTHLPGWEDLQHFSKEWMGDRSQPFMTKLLTQPPLNLTPAAAANLVPDLRYFWAAIANGDSTFSFPQFPDPINQYLARFSAIDQEGNPRLIDNSTVIFL
ncbi:MAG: metallophosphoesterase [Timaviella obliquedivisa GSE-PSE-MK23-08B]|jgi:predicted phosphohydrolase|nr:metallophosphoesterase [Timaviella obliquedivisa GSE-PSE-MK23-08B]